MSVKGKEKSVEVIPEDEVDDIAFFTSKRRFRARPVSPTIQQPPPPKRKTKPSSDSEDDAPVVSRRADPFKATSKPLPQWTKVTTSKGNDRKNGKRGSTEERRNTGQSQTIVIGDSGDEGSLDAKGKKRKRVVLTPPPELSASKLAEIERLVKSRYPDPVPIELPSSPEKPTSPPKLPIPKSSPTKPASSPIMPVSKTRLILRGEQGEHKLNVEPDVTAGRLLRYYCAKAGIGSGLDPVKYRLELDGDVIALGTEIRHMGVEDGDLIDVVAA